MEHSVELSCTIAVEKNVQRLSSWEIWQWIISFHSMKESKFRDYFDVHCLMFSVDWSRGTVGEKINFYKIWPHHLGRVSWRLWTCHPGNNKSLQSGAQEQSRERIYCTEREEWVFIIVFVCSFKINIRHGPFVPNAWTNLLMKQKKDKWWNTTVMYMM